MLRLRPSTLLQILLSAILLVVGVIPVAAKPHRPKDPKQQINDLEQQWRTATLNSDVPLMDKLLSEDYVGISWNGQVNNKASQLDRLRSRRLAITTMDLSDLKIKIVGAVAIVTSRAEVIGTSDGVELDDVFRYTRVYQHLPSGTWKITNLEATRLPRLGQGGRRGHGGPPPPDSIQPASAHPVPPPPSN